MLNVDFKKLEAVSQFLDFIDAISKPKELAATLASMQKEADSLRQLLGAKQTVEKANLFMDECRKEMQTGFDELSAKEDRFESERAEKEKSLFEKTEALEAQKHAQAKFAQELDSLAARLEEANKEAEARSRKVSLNEKALKEREAELEAKEAAFIEKAAKLKQLMGE